MGDVLPDILEPGLRLVVCGSAAGRRSAELGAYYAGPGNRFWPTLHSIGLTPMCLRPQDYAAIRDFGIGLTDMAKTAFGADRDLRPGDSDALRLRNWIVQNQPRILAFNGKRPARSFFGHVVPYGWQAGGDLGITRIFVAPSTSGAARGFWNEDLWRELADAVRAP